MKLNNKNVTQFPVLLWKIIVTSAEGSSTLRIIDKIMVSLMCTLGPYTYVSVAWLLWSCYGLCQRPLEELGICGIQNSSAHQDFFLHKYLIYKTIFFSSPSYYSNTTPSLHTIILAYMCDHTITLNFSSLLLPEKVILSIFITLQLHLHWGAVLFSLDKDN